MRQIFLYSLHDEAVSSLRKMLTIEQFRSPELSEMYTRRYVDRLVDYHAGIFEGLINAGVIKEHDAKTLAMMYTLPVLLLMRNVGQVIAKSSMLERIAEDTPDCTESSLKTHVSHLRAKLRAVDGTDHIEAVWGIGFRLVDF